MRMAWIAPLVAVGLATTVPAAAAPDTDRTAVRQALDAIVAGGAGAALVELRDEHGTWRAASGVRELGRPSPVPVGGRFRAGSVTKAFVATVVLQLADEGRLRLDDPLRRWLPGAVPDDTVTLRQLLAHTSGIADYTAAMPLDPEGMLANRWRTWEPWELVRLSDRLPPPTTPWSYSSTNYVLLGLVVQRVTGRPYGAEVERRIIRPLGLRGTSVPGTFPFILGPHPHGYVPVVRDGRPQPVDITAFNPSAPWAAGEIVSTTADLNRFHAALLGGRLVSADRLRDMIGPTAGSERETSWGGHQVRSAYGLGQRRFELDCGITVYGHDGDAPGFSTWSFATADTRSQVTLSLTWGTGRPSAAARALLGTAFCAGRG